MGVNIAIRVTNLPPSVSFDLEPVPWYKYAFIAKNTSTRELTETQEYKEGKFYIQNLSSMVPAIVLDPQPTDLVLDIAAAPGSKTTQIAQMMGNQGIIIANDISRARNFTLLRALKTFGITNTQVITSPGQNIWERYPEYFDRSLADVPCSMLQSEPIEDMRAIKALAIRQQYILRSAISATRVGGTIIYSTCTITRQENEGVIEKILAKEAGNIELESINIPKLDLSPGMIPNTYRINPNELMEGFFVAKLRKIKSNI